MYRQNFLDLRIQNIALVLTIIKSNIHTTYVHINFFQINLFLQALMNLIFLSGELLLLYAEL